MEGRRKFQNANVGIISLVVIFTLLCLAVFSMLALSTATNEGKLAEKNSKAVKDYYSADFECSKIAAKLAGLWEDSDRDFGLIEEYCTKENLKFDAENSEIKVAYEKRIDGFQKISVVLLLGDSFEIISWKTVSDANWEPNQALEVWDGE